MKFVFQRDQSDCGPACLSMISSYYGNQYDLEYIREQSYLSRDGVSLLGISLAAQKMGFDTFSSKLSIQELTKHSGSQPCILHWNQNHFVILMKITKSFSKKYYHIVDPEHGFVKLTEEKFKQSWLSDQNEGIALFLSPLDEFYTQAPPKRKKMKLAFFLNYLIVYKKQIFTLFFMLLIGCCISIIFPFLTQNLIDKGVNNRDLNIVVLILLSQLGLYLGLIITEIIRNWLMLYVGTKISITIISDFLRKLLNLPIKFFDSKMMGDFYQRINDNERIEKFLTSQSLITFFSLITFLVFFGVLLYYDVRILLIYAILTTTAIFWSLFWLKKRKKLDYDKFQQKSKNQDSIYEILNGVTEMKLNQFDDFKREEWETHQNKLFKININILKIDQLQLSGFEFINQIKNILVTFFAATLVIKGSMSLGELLAISYIIGQLNSPVNQLVSFIRSLQDAKLSMERLNEVQNHPKEELENLKMIKKYSSAGIELKNISFQYEGPKSPFVLKDINLHIPDGKVTAIVGGSGSGKTTLLKLLLRFYEPTHGRIYYNGDNILTLSPKSIRENCGVVMQDGYIFSDTIERNVATSEKNINQEKIQLAIKIANIASYIEKIPLGCHTKVGGAGSGISGGQKQRILIARAVYKNPHYIFFDEATSALDAENERIIHNNLQNFFKHKTVIIIAHRLSTVKNADQIVVLKQGEIVERGTHDELVEKKKEYYNLVKNQLELGQ